METKMDTVMTFKRARSLAVQYSGARAKQADEIARHMLATGDCVWHAVYVVRGRTGACWCADCSPQVASLSEVV